MPKSKNKREGQTSPANDEEEEDSDNQYTEKILRSKKTKKGPPPRVASSESDAPSIKGGDSDVDTTASEEKKYLPDSWVLTWHVLIRVQNTPRRSSLYAKGGSR